jgi:hypothetical protein
MHRIRSVTALVLVLALGQALFVVPAAAQDDAYQAALESGNLALLVPSQFAEVDIEPGRGSFVLPPFKIDSDSEAAVAELEAIMEAAGTTRDDVIGVGSAMGVDSPITFSATRVPGIAAVDWFELVYRAFRYRNLRDSFRETDSVGPKQVLRFTDRDRDRSRTFYAQGEILWELSGDEGAVMQFLEGLTTIDGPALSADPEGLVDGEPVVLIGTADDPLSQIPPEIRGAATETQTIPLATALEGIDQANAEDVEAAERIRAMLDGVGGIDRANFIIVQAAGEDGGVSGTGLNVDGADVTGLVDGFIDLFVGTRYDSIERTEEQLGGKSVTRIAEADTRLTQPTWVYAVGETVWMLQGQDEYVAALLRTMP